MVAYLQSYHTWPFSSLPCWLLAQSRCCLYRLAALICTLVCAAVDSLRDCFREEVSAYWERKRHKLCCNDVKQNASVKKIKIHSDASTFGQQNCKRLIGSWFTIISKEYNMERYTFRDDFVWFSFKMWFINEDLAISLGNDLIIMPCDWFTRM